jgi:glucosamine--fructose-6-phosphate aminotransferase (isomerizing)
VFKTETDAEVVVHLVERHYTATWPRPCAPRTRSSRDISRSSSSTSDHPEELVGARVQCPLIVGVGDGEMFLASAATAFLRETNKLQLIEDGEVVSIKPDGATFTCVQNGSEPIDAK